MFMYRLRSRTHKALIWSPPIHNCSEPLLIEAQSHFLPSSVLPSTASDHFLPSTVLPSTASDLPFPESDDSLQGSSRFVCVQIEFKSHAPAPIYNMYMFSKHRYIYIHIYIYMHNVSGIRE